MEARALCKQRHTYSASAESPLPGSVFNAQALFAIDELESLLHSDERMLEKISGRTGVHEVGEELPAGGDLEKGQPQALCHPVQRSAGRHRPRHALDIR